MATAIALEALAASARPTAETATFALAVLAGLAGAWLQAVHPPASGYGHDAELVSLLVA